MNPKKQISIMIVDDEPHVLRGTETLLLSEGFEEIYLMSDSEMVMNELKNTQVDLILLDLFMPRKTGEELMEEILSVYPDMKIIVITGFNDIERAVGCIKCGCFDYLVKPVDEVTLLSRIQQAMDHMDAKKEIEALKEKVLSDDLANPQIFESIITRNPKMISLFKYMEAISISSQPVLISGETGVGKELFAGAIAKLSKTGGEYIMVNAAGLDDQMFADTLFGHKKGAFTGAMEKRDGMLKKAKNGVLFLDEIGDLSQTSQIKLLRVIQEKQYYQIGSDDPIKTNAKIICATNKNLKEMVSNQSFRKDLYFRLCSHQINIPPLRERKEDLPLLLDHIIETTSKELEKKPPLYPQELIVLLEQYHFPGNVRELETMIFDALSIHKTHLLKMDSFQKIIINDQKHDDTEPMNIQKTQFPEQLPTIKELTQDLVDEALKRSKGNQSMAARLLGITQQALSKRLKQ